MNIYFVVIYLKFKAIKTESASLQFSNNFFNLMQDFSLFDQLLHIIMIMIQWPINIQELNILSNNFLGLSCSLSKSELSNIQSLKDIIRIKVET